MTFKRLTVAACALLFGVVMLWALFGSQAAVEEAALLEPVAAPKQVPVELSGFDAGAWLEGASVAGVVRRGAVPVAGARVALFGLVNRETFTADGGVFRFEQVPAGEAFVSATFEKDASDVLGPLWLAPAEQRENLVLELLASASVSGQVIDAQTRDPIAGAVVSSTSGLTKTDRAGRFSLGPLSARQTWLDASAPGHHSRMEWVSLGSARAHSGLVIALEPSSWLEGTVSQQARPSPGARVWAELQVGSRVGQTFGPAVSLSDGTFKLEAAPGLLRLNGTLADGTRVQGPTVRVKPGERKTGLLLEAGEALSQEGVVRADGQPLVGATLIAFDSRTEAQIAQAFSGAEGKFRFDRLAVGRYSLQVRHASLVAQSGPWEQTGEGLPWSVEVSAGAGVRGRVEPPSANVKVRFRSGDWAGPAAELLTDAQGRFAFKGVPPGTVLLEAEGEAGSAAARVQASEQEVVLKLERGGLRIAVTDSRGAPVTDFVLNLLPQSGGLARRMPVLSPTGKFSVELPAGNWQVQVFAEGHSSSQPQPVTIGKGATELEVKLRGGIEVRGAVLDAATGLPLRGASIEVLHVSGPSGAAFRVTGRTSNITTDGRGEFVVPSVPLPSSIVARAEGYTPGWLGMGEDAPSPMRVELKLQKGPVREPPPVFEYEGIGAQLQSDQTKVWVAQVYENSPAESAGLNAGDVILEVNGTRIGPPAENAVKVIQGPAGSVVRMRIQRGTDSLEFFIRRRAIAL